MKKVENRAKKFSKWLKIFSGLIPPALQSDKYIYGSKKVGDSLFSGPGKMNENRFYEMKCF